MDVVDVVGDSLTDRFECLAADAFHGVVDGVPCGVEAIVRVMLDDVDGRNAGLDEFYMIIVTAPPTSLLKRSLYPELAAVFHTLSTSHGALLIEKYSR